MAGESQFTIGARASCTDGDCGEVSRLIFDPATCTLTHLAIQPGHQQEAARLVPVHLAKATDDGIRLHCTLAEFGKFDHAVERHLVTGEAPGRGAGRSGLPVGPSATQKRRWRETATFEDVVPGRADEVGPGDPVLATDGEIGRVQGFLVNPDDDRVTHVLLQEGHLWGRKEVAIPISAVIRLDEGIVLNLTMEQVRDLPPVA
jgi:sporulation protein YlmC with PRC-barrel domain